MYIHVFCASVFMCVCVIVCVCVHVCVYVCVCVCVCVCCTQWAGGFQTPFFAVGGVILLFVPFLLFLVRGKRQSSIATSQSMHTHWAYHFISFAASEVEYASFHDSVMFVSNAGVVLILCECMLCLSPLLNNGLTHAHKYICTHTCTHTCICTCAHIRTLTHTCTCTCTHTYTNTHMHMHTYTYIHVHMHTHMHTHTYTHTHTHSFDGCHSDLWIWVLHSHSLSFP